MSAPGASPSQPPAFSYAPPPTTTLTPPPYYNKAAFDKDGMSYIRLGTTGVVVSRLCLGLMIYGHFEADEAPMFPFILNAAQAEPFVQQALDAGITFFDTAEVYSDGRSELFFGHALKKLLPLSRYTREDLFIATKIQPGRTMGAGSFGGLQKGLSRKALFAAVNGSLERLQLDYIDLYIIHRYDHQTAPEETMKALHDLVVSGKVRYIGASSMFAWQLARLQRVAEVNGWTRFSSMQNHVNLLYREEEHEMIPYCVDNGIACTPWAPLAAGVLARLEDDEPSTRAKTDPIQKHRYYKQGDDEVVAQLRAIAKKRGIPPAQVALAWLMQKQGIAAPVIGASKPHHIADAVKALQVKLTEEEVKQLEANYLPHRITGHV